MKAERRHQLKTNELAESLGELPQYLRDHGAKIVTVAIVVLAAVVAAYWFFGSRKKALSARHAAVQEQIVQLDLAQLTMAGQAARRLKGEADEMFGTAPYDTDDLAKRLQAIAQEAPQTATGMLALIYQAEAVRSQLLFTERTLSLGEREQLCKEATDLYNDLLAEYPNDTTAVGMGKMGLALLAEEQGQWDSARQRYEEIVTLGQETLAGTVFPRQAARRLAMLDKISERIEFREVAIPVQSEEAPHPEALSTESAAEEMIPGQSDSVTE